MPPDFQHVGGTYRTYGHGESIDIWSVLSVPREEHPRHRFSHYYNVVGRLRSGVSRGEMDADLRQTSESVAGRPSASNNASTVTEWIAPHGTVTAVRPGDKLD